MPENIVAAAPEQSLRPLTQLLVGSLEVAFEEVAALRNHENGPWVYDFEERIIASTVGLGGKGGDDANAVQVGISALRACFRHLRSQLR
ncbi:MAG: hypothetical protein JWM36_3270 [Hyphomicrobiales bacterium]|nr:hypothetical protein [Hyphomicrobiales bacterium]